MNSVRPILVACTLTTALAVPPAAAGEAAESAQVAAWLQEQSQPDGYRSGGFLVRPEVAFSGVYDSNIFATRKDEIEDGILVFAPEIDFDSTWDRHRLGVDLGGAFGRYSSSQDEDYDDYWINADGRYDISDNSNVFGGVGYSHEHEDRGSPEDNYSGSGPTVYDSSRAHAGVSRSWGKTSVRFGGTYEALSFDDAGTLTNKDRDRDMLGAGLRVSHALNPRYVIYGQGIWDKRDYDLSMDDYGYQRDSEGYRVDIGLQVTISNRLKGEALVGYLRQDYDDPRFYAVDTVDFGGDLEWLVSPRTTVSFELDRSLEETTLIDPDTLLSSSGYLYTALTGSVRHRLSPRMNINAGLSVADASYQQLDRTDKYYSAQVGMRYYLTPRYYLGAEYRVLQRDSDTSTVVNNTASPQALDDYARNQFFLTLGTLLYPVQQSSYWDMNSLDALQPVTAGWPGFYAGAQLGRDTLNLHTQGGRDQGTDSGEFSDSGAGGGLFTGYGWSWNRWYAGLEAEYADGNASIHHSKSKAGSRTLDLDRNSSYGLAVRAGYQLPAGTLLYGRLGKVRTNFDAYTTVNSRPEDAFDEQRTEDGLRYGIGTDIPLSEHLFVRLDYSLTEYDDFDAHIVDSSDVTQTESFSPKDSLFRLGLGWQAGSLGGVPRKQQVHYDGPYAGAHIGHGSVQSHVTGSQIDGGGDPGPFSFVGDFGDDSATNAGVFLGYGFTNGRIYGGLEGEIEDSNAGWEHWRNPGGRDFSVEKAGSRGIFLRSGYILDSGSLLYVRVGPMRTRFNTTWAKGMNALNYVDRDDVVTGIRMGVGAEVPFTRSLFARLDYSYTDYDSYSFVTSQVQADDMKFNNTETLFRLGVGAHF